MPDAAAVSRHALPMKAVIKCRVLISPPSLSCRALREDDGEELARRRPRAIPHQRFLLTGSVHRTVVGLERSMAIGYRGLPRIGYERPARHPPGSRRLVLALSGCEQPAHQQ